MIFSRLWWNLLGGNQLKISPKKPKWTSGGLCQKFQFKIWQNYKTSSFCVWKLITSRSGSLKGCRKGIVVKNYGGKWKLGHFPIILVFHDWCFCPDCNCQQLPAHQHQHRQGEEGRPLLHTRHNGGVLGQIVPRQDPGPAHTPRGYIYRPICIIEKRNIKKNSSIRCRGLLSMNMGKRRYILNQVHHHLRSEFLCVFGALDTSIHPPGRGGGI